MKSGWEERLQLKSPCASIASIVFEPHEHLYKYGCGEFACCFFCILPRGLGMVCNVDFAHSCGAGAAVASLNI